MLLDSVETLRRLKIHAEQIRNDQPQRVETCSPYDAWPQGDLLLVSLDALPAEAAPCEGRLQLIEGDTHGSRHYLDSLDGVEFYRLPDATPLDGPIMVVHREFTVLHPEHGDITLPAGIWGVVYQRQFADALQRIRD